MVSRQVGMVGLTLSERDICTKRITPAVVKAGWDLVAERDRLVMREEADRLIAARAVPHTQP